MKWKNLAILLILAAGAVWTVLELQRPAATPPSTQADPMLFGGLEEQLNDVIRIRIGSGERLVAELERTGDGWVVASKHGYPADLGAIREWLLALAQAEIIEPKTANPELYARIGVAEPGTDGGGRLVEVETPERTFGLIVGDRAGGGRQTYVRRVGEQQSLLVSGDLTPAGEPRQWLRQPLLDIAAERFQRVTIRHPDGEVLTLSRPDRDAINLQPETLPEGRELSYGSVANPTGAALSGLRIENLRPLADLPPEQRGEPIKAEYLGFDGLQVTATVFEADGQRYLTLAAGFDAEQQRRFASDESGEAEDESPSSETVAAEAEALDQRLAGWAFVVTDYQFDNLSKRLDDLLAPVEETAEDDLPTDGEEIEQ
jgi:hypothetical protein